MAVNIKKALSVGFLAVLAPENTVAIGADHLRPAFKNVPDLRVAKRSVSAVATDFISIGIDKDDLVRDIGFFFYGHGETLFDAGF
jgi:hypothetical protein